MRKRPWQRFPILFAALLVNPLCSTNASAIKGAERRQQEDQHRDLTLQDTEFTRKDQTPGSKVPHKFPYEFDWRDRLFPPTFSPTTSRLPSTSPSTSRAPSTSPSSMPSIAPSLSDTPSEGPSSSPTRTATYVPGKLAYEQNGLLLSEGLQSRIIATANQTLTFVNGSISEEPFHEEPDGAGVFADPETGGWIYVSNSEKMRGGGGVGAIVFNSDGEVVDYKKLLRGTSRNCAGGKTPWNTWVSCEESPNGEIWQIDPKGIRPPEVTSMCPVLGWFESFAYDIRDFDRPRFFVTEDQKDGALRRFTPSDPNWNDPWTILHGNGTLEYLVLVPHTADKKDEIGTYYWTTDFQLARENANFFYQNTEGLDVYNNEMFFVSKAQKSLFILDLDGNSYKRFSTRVGIFDGQPDQMNRLIKNGPSNIEVSSTFDVNEEEEPLLYFCEDGGKKNGIHARDANGWFFTILEAMSDDRSETSGLAFSPDGKHMYFSYQLKGIIYDVWRDDGLPFYGKTLDVHYHAHPQES